MSRRYVCIKSSIYIEYDYGVLTLADLQLGDLSNWGWDNKESMGATTRPLGVEVYRLTDPAILDGWQQPKVPNYTGMNGIKMPRRDETDGYVGL